MFGLQVSQCLFIELTISTKYRKNIFNNNDKRINSHDTVRITL